MNKPLTDQNTKELIRKGFIVLASGGTGGHVFPAIALNAVLSKTHDITLMTDHRGQRFLPSQRPLNVSIMAIKRRPGVWGQIVYLATLSFETVKCILQFLFRRPICVVGFGGYPSFPPMLAAQMLKIPTFIHEQNALMGKANRYLQKKAKSIGLSFPVTKGARHDAIFVGNPVRQAIVDAAQTPYTPSSDGLFRLLILGGSQGSQIFSSIIPETISLFPPAVQSRFIITQQCRAELLEETAAHYAKLSCNITLETFFQNVEELYTQADLIITRSGASTTAEIAVLGRPALFIPLAVSLEGDQRHNAQQFVDHQAGWMITEKDLTPATLKQYFENVLNTPQILLQAAAHAKKLGVQAAAENLKQMILKID